MQPPLAGGIDQVQDLRSECVLRKLWEMRGCLDGLVALDFLSMVFQGRDV